MPAVMLMVLEYVMVLAVVVADLVSGIRKARLRGEARRSKALRLSIDKLARYYNALMALSVLDSMQIAAVIYLRCFEQYQLLIFPLFTLLGALGMALIELKSIFEKEEEKQQADYRDAADALMKILRTPDLVNHIINSKKQ